MQEKIIKKEEILNKKGINILGNCEIVNYSEGFFCVKNCGRYYLVSEDLSKKFGPFEYPTCFSCGLAVGDLGCKVIDTDGNVVFTKYEKNLCVIDSYIQDIAIAMIFDNTNLVDKTVAINKNGNRILNKKKFEVIFDFTDDVTPAICDGKCYIIDKKGNKITELKALPKKGFTEGLCPVVLNEDKQFSFIDKNGNVVISNVGCDARSFSCGLAAVKDKESGKWGYIDKEGNLKIPFVYYEAYAFQNGYAVVSDKNRKSPSMNLIDINGNKILENDYNSIKICDGVIIIDREYYVPIKDLKVKYFICEKGNEEVKKEFLSKEERDLYFELYNNEVKNIEDTLTKMKDAMYFDLDKKVDAVYKLKTNK